MELSEIDRDVWLNSITAAGQDIELIDGTLRDNLSLGLEAVSKQEIAATLELSNASEFVTNLPIGLDSKVESHEIRLSGGQRQRLILARALLRSPQILVLDEATNSVDSISEAAIIDNIPKALPDLTLIIIAHRGPAAAKADNVSVLDEGRIVEQGTPKELLRDSNSVFSKILNSGSLESKPKEPSSHRTSARRAPSNSSDYTRGFRGTIVFLLRHHCLHRYLRLTRPLFHHELFQSGQQSLGCHFLGSCQHSSRARYRCHGYHHRCQFCHLDWR